LVKEPNKHSISPTRSAAQQGCTLKHTMPGLATVGDTDLDPMRWQRWLAMTKRIR